LKSCFCKQQAGAAPLPTNSLKADGGLAIMDTAFLSALFNLSIPERIRLVEALWDSIAQEANAVPLPDWQRLE